MKKFLLFTSIFEIIIGMCSIIAFIILIYHNENIIKWLPALILSIFFIIEGILGIIRFQNKK